MSNKNKGDKGEKQCIQHCFDNQNNSIWCMKHFKESKSIKLIDPVTKKIIQSVEDIKKAPSGCKADILILLETSGEILYPSIKTTNCSPPSILNHTHRNARAFQSKLIKYLPYIDNTIKYYIEKRKAGTIAEDVKLLKLINYCNNKNEVKYAWKKIISYFAFSGTGSKDSICPANSVLLWDGNKIKFYDCKTEEQKESYIESILSKDLFVISIRKKAMPKHICDEHMPWIFEHIVGDEIKIKGCLSIRQLTEK